MSLVVSKGNSPYRVSSGQADSGDVVVSGGSMYVLSGGTALTTTNVAGQADKFITSWRPVAGLCAPIEAPNVGASLVFRPELKEAGQAYARRNTPTLTP